MLLQIVFLRVRVCVLLGCRGPQHRQMSNLKQTMNNAMYVPGLKKHLVKLLL